MWRYVVVALLICVASCKPLDKKPNILFIVADDFGWNDVGFHNPDMITPNIDKLAKSGMILNQAYVQPVCTPSRNSWLSGYYPFRSGFQHAAMLPEQAVCSPLNRTFLPQHLKAQGYATHMIGKWHLGFCKWECTPTFRGFDSFYGYYNGMEDYYSESIHGTFGFCKWECTPTFRGFDTFYGYYNGQEDYYSEAIMNYKDFRDGKQTVEPNGEYSAHRYAKRAEQLIKAHNQSQPLFLYLPFQSVHIPIQVPKQYENMYPKIQHTGRRQFCGMVSAMDEAIGNITEALKAQGMFENTLILFTADNGGWTQFHGNNYPLRGGKITIFEGGTRASSFITGPGIQQSAEPYDGMIHAVDWMPTLVSAAGGTVENDDMDGMDHWDAITNLEKTKRTEFIYNLDDLVPALNGHAAIRSGKYKLIDGYPGPYPNWYKPDSVDTDWELEELKAKEYADKVMLFDLEADPTEHVDLSEKLPDVVKQLQAKMADYHKKIVPALWPKNDPASVPASHDDFWAPGWC